MAIFELFNQEWFLQVWVGQEEDMEGGNEGIKQEICLALIEACLISPQKNQAWLYMAIQVAEIASKCLDWQAKDESLNLEVCMNYFLFLE